jgi:hypothetical protein
LKRNLFLPFKDFGMRCIPVIIGPFLCSLSWPKKQGLLKHKFWTCKPVYMDVHTEVVLHDQLWPCRTLQPIHYMSTAV